MKIETRKQISVQDWDKLVQSTYDKPYSFQQQDGCKERGIETIYVDKNLPKEDFENTSIPFKTNHEEMGVSFETWLNTNPNDTLKHFKYDWQNALFWERNFYPHINMITLDLCNKNLLEPGEYDIKIDW